MRVTGMSLAPALVLLLLAAACAPATTRSGLTFAEAKEREVRLAVGMSTDEVAELFLAPQRTRRVACGEALAPDGCLEWTYVFPATTTCGIVMGQVVCPRSAASDLVMRFGPVGDRWSLESWGWRIGGARGR